MSTGKKSDQVNIVEIILIKGGLHVRIRLFYFLGVRKIVFIKNIAKLNLQEKRFHIIIIVAI